MNQRQRYLRTLQRYVLCEIVRSFAICFLVLAVILFLVASVRLLHKGLNVVQLRGAAFALGISFFPYLLPFAFMTGLVMAFGRLSADNEILAIRAAGIHLANLLPAVLLCGMLLSMAAFLTNASLVPSFQRRLESLEVDVFRGFLKRLQALPSKMISLPAYDVLVGSVEGRSCRDIVLFEARGGRVQEILRAEEMRIELDAAKGGVRLNLRNCSLVTPTEDPPKYVREAFLGSLTRDIDMGFKARRIQLDPTALSLQDLIRKSGEIAGSLQSYPGLLPKPKKMLKATTRNLELVLAEYNAKAQELQKAREAFEIERYRLMGLEHRIETLEKEMRRPNAADDLQPEIEKSRMRVKETRFSMEAKGREIGEIKAAADKLAEQQRLVEAQMQQATLQCSSIEIASEIQHRLALSVAPLMLGLIAFPLGASVKRRGFLTAFAASSAFALLGYYPLSLLGDMLSRNTQIGPHVFIWLPNAGAGVVGVLLLVAVFRR